MGKDIFNDALTQRQVSDETLAKQRLQAKTSELNEDLNETKIKKHVPMSGRMPELDYKNIPLENLPTKGMFYPPNTSIHIKSASTKAIRHFSSVDERDYLAVDDKLNYIIEQCVKVYMPEKPGQNGPATYKDIFEYDRIYLVLAIKELTFLKSDNSITMNIECNHCGNKESIQITKESIPQIVLPETLESRWNPEELCFIFKMKDDEQELKLKLPTLGVTHFTKNYARTKSYNGQFIDESMLKTIMYLNYDHSKLNEKLIKDIDLDISKTWSHKKLSLVDKLISIFDESMSMKIVNMCNSCGEESAHDIQFQKGYKSLFLYTDILDELV